MSDKKRHVVKMCATLDRERTSDVILWTDGKPRWDEAAERWTQVGDTGPLCKFVTAIPPYEIELFLGIKMAAGKDSLVEFDLITERD